MDDSLDDPQRAAGPVFLVVDDDPMVRKIVIRGLDQLNPAAVLEVEDGLAAQAVLQQRPVDIVVTDVVMPHMDGLELMKWAQQHRPGPLWIILSGLETFDAAVDALQLGAFDYLAKPPEIPRVRVAVRNALDQIELVRERERLYNELKSSNSQLAEKVDQLQKVCRVLEDQAAVIQADLDRAEIIQRALLPQDPPAIPGWCIETLYRPGSSVGGDFYDAVVIDDGHLGLVIADAAGHGVAAAMLSVLFKLRLKQVDSEGAIMLPNQVLQLLNSRLFETLSAPGAFITAAYVLLDLRTGAGRLASAGHPPCIHKSPDGTSQLLRRTGPALGLETEPHFDEHQFQLNPGDRLMLYTDGVIEGGERSPSTEDIATELGKYRDKGELLCHLFENAVHGLSGDRDDITMLLLQRGEGTSHFDDTPSPEDRSQADTSSGVPQLLQGASEEHAFIAISGSITWLVGQALLDCARRLLEKHTRLTIDLADCQHMDSTCLGTLHEIVISNPDKVELQAVPADVRELFEELSMSAVIAHISTDKAPLPGDMSAINAKELSPQEQGARILSAHETLSSLSPENEEQFRTVVDSLRVDLNSAD